MGGGGKKGATIDYGGGGQTCARSAHSEREARADLFELLGSDFFFGQTCARSALTSRFWGGVQGPALGPLAGCRGRAPAGGPGGSAPGRFWIYAFQSPKIAVFESHISHFLKG